MRVVVCAIAKNEHNYINEWVKHYLSLNVDHIYIFDNDNANAKYIGCCIDKKYKDKITIYNYRGVKMKYLQHTLYNLFYHTHKFDWVLFVDIDEFLMGVKDIHNLTNINYQQVRIKWKLFGDDNIIERDTSIPVNGFFKQEKHDGRLEYQNKSLVRGGLNIQINSCHFVKYLKSCFPSGKQCQNKELNILDYENEKVFIYHYMTKTLSEFINQKLNRGDAVWSNRKIGLDYFWRINEKTTEKIEYLKNMGLE